jgi:hypothetical protein
MTSSTSINGMKLISGSSLRPRTAEVHRGLAYLRSP